MKRMTGCLCLAIALAIALPPPPARATDYTVTHAGGKEGIYCDPPPAFNADLLSELLANCGPGDTVTVEAGTYTLTDPNSQTLVLTHGVKLIGKGMPVLDGGGVRRVIEYRSTSSTTPSATLLSGFVIRNGLVDPNLPIYGGGGGGMLIDSGSLTVEGCIFMGNEAKSGSAAGTSRHLSGGGLAVEGDCFPQIVDCVFTGNAAGQGGGGGMYIGRNARPTVKGCTFLGNATEDGNGGGMLIEGGSPTVTGCAFIGNSIKSSYDGTIVGNGGGICIEGGTASIRGCTFTHNMAGGGSGMYITNGPTVRDCVFTGNTSAGSGGAIYMTGGTVEASTFAGNSGGGMIIGGAGSPLVTNCTFSENDGDGLSIKQSASPTVTNCTLVDSGTSEVRASGTSSPKFVNTLLWNDNASNAVVIEGSAAVSLTNCAGPAGIASGDSAAYVALSWLYHLKKVEMGHTVYPIAGNEDPLQGLVGKGTSAGAPAADQLGRARKSPPCIGAVEHDGLTGISLDKDALDLTVGGHETLTATLSPTYAVATIAWASTNAAVATVDDAGQVTAVAPGAAAVTATADGQMAVCVVTVTGGGTPDPGPSVTSVTLDKATLSLAVGSADVLTATVLPAGATVVWASTHPAVASVDAAGQVTAVAPGAAAITATAGGRMAVCVVTVTGDGGPDPGPSVTSVTLDRATLSLAVGSVDVLTATTVPAGATVVWASTHPAVASVDAAGQVTGAAPGMAIVTASSGGEMAFCVVTVGDGRVPVTGISLDRATLSLAVGSTDVLTATTVPAGATVVWASTHPAVASVDAAGQVTGAAPGMAIVTASSGGEMAFCVVTVEDGRPGGTSGGGGCSSLGLGGLAMVACAASVLKRKAQRHRRTRTS